MSNFAIRTGTQTATIPNGGTTTGPIDLGGATLQGIITSAALTGTTFHFLGSVDGVHFFPVYLNGAQYSVTVAAGQYIAMPALDLVGLRWIEIVSSSTEAAARVLTLVTRPVS